MVHYFGEKTWVELDNCIHNNAVIILPVGTTEEHGRHLPVETDAIIAEAYGRMLGDACDKAGIAMVFTGYRHFKH